MTKVGILVHCRHLETLSWEDLVFGDPAQDKLGDQSTLARVVLSLEPSEELECIVFGRGPSWRDGLDEGAYSKKYLLDNLERLKEFPRLQPLFAQFDPSELAAFKRAMEQVIVTEEIKNTVHEIEAAAKLFNERGVTKVIQIAAASHASRCIKEQNVARSKDLIDAGQLWMTVATDMCYEGIRPEDVCVIEPLHRRDQPMTFVRPGLSEVIAPYFFLPDDDKKQLVQMVSEFMSTRK